MFTSKDFKCYAKHSTQCLLPLANIPLINYTLEFLALAGVEDVFIFVSAHAEKIEHYIRNSKWNTPSSPFKKCQIIMSPSSMSVGDAMRELDGKSIITTDFLLVNGDVVGNIPLEAILAQHRKRRTQDKNAIMTMILKPSGFEHRTKPRGEHGVFIIDETCDRCVHYEELRPHGKLLLSPELTKNHPRLRVRADLIDCHIDICSPDVPALFTENFDYQQLRRHFLHGILTDYELYGKTVHTHIISQGYAARVSSLQTYDAVSKDIIGRWTYPLVPDTNLGPGQKYTCDRRNIYWEEGVILARSCEVQRNTIIGRGTSIGEGSRISDSVIGDGCKIGKNVTLESAYIWNNVTIEDGCKIENSIVGYDAIIGLGSVVNPGTIISGGVKIPAETNLPSFSRITCHKKRSSRSEELGNDKAMIGSEYSASESESDDEKACVTQIGLGTKCVNNNI
jgi:translation initiation factor eIF-2B subunit epsilon